MSALPPESLEDIFSKHGAAEAISSALIAEGWTTDTFRFVAADQAQFDLALPELLGSASATLLQKAALRSAFQSLQDHGGPNPSSSSSPASSSQTVQSTSWSETFPPKLEPATLAALKQTFAQSYPSELLLSDMMPAPRLVALIHDQLAKKQWKWIPWKFRMTASKAEEITTGRASKLPRVEGLGLYNLLIDNPPELEVTNGSMGLNMVRNILEVHDRGMALCQGCHLHNLKAYTHKFLTYLTIKYDSDLRTPTVLEAQSLDKAIWNAISDLMDKGWSMDDAVHELTVICNDLPSLLQARPRPAKSTPPPSSPSFSRPETSKGKTKGGGKGKKGGGGKGKGKVQWITEVRKDGAMHTLCMRFQVHKCSNASCQFVHGCAYPVEVNGRMVACGKDHEALAHFNTPR